MKNFNNFAEALLVSVAPQSDSVGAVEECPCKKRDMFSQSADELLNSISPIQPDDNVGETGEIQNDSESTEEGSDIELECTEDGLRVKFGGIEVVLPKSVVDSIKAHESDEEHEEHEESESPAEEEAEHAEGGSEENEEEVEEETVTESKAKSKKKPPFWMKFKKGKKDKKDKEDTE